MRRPGDSAELYVGRAPVGFLDVLGTKVNGRAPQFLADTVVPTVDYFPWITLNRLVYRQATFNPLNSVGNWHDTGNVVPDGQCYWVKSVSLISQSLLAAATTLRVAIGYKVDGSTLQVIKIGREETSTTGQFLTATYQGPGFLLRPGQAVGFFVSQAVLGANPIGLLDYEYVPLVL